MKPNEIRAAAHATMAALVFVALITLYGEISAPFEGWLKSIFWHHWVGKSILSIVMFALVYFFQKDRVSNAKPDMMEMTKQIVVVSILAGIAIFAFFLWNFTKG
jgi:ABC-type Fe3+-siderophore transport system permease subunit